MEYRHGDLIPWQHGKVKVMAQADSYLMVRYPGCMPFVISMREANQFVKQHGTQVTQEPKENQLLSRA